MPLSARCFAKCISQTLAFLIFIQPQEVGLRSSIYSKNEALKSSILAQSHTEMKWQFWDFNSDLLLSRACVYN